ncbi:hypothetical protein COOONC_05040 [Cooperia oncophora]
MMQNFQPLHEVGIDTKSFEEFSQLENAVTKCTELMLYELNYGEDDLLNCLVFSKQPAMCPVSPDPITRRERQIQTSPPTVGARPPSRPARTVTPDAQALPGRPVTPLAQPSTASTSQDTSEDIDAIDGYSLVSDDELQVIQVQVIEYDKSSSKFVHQLIHKFSKLRYNFKTVIDL